MWMVESSIPIAMMLLSWGWKARKVEAGGGGIKVVITCKSKQFQPKIHTLLMVHQKFTTHTAHTEAVGVYINHKSTYIFAS